MSPPVFGRPASSTSLANACLAAGIWHEHGGEGGIHQRAAQGCSQAAPGRAGAEQRQGRLTQPPQRCHPGTVPCLCTYTHTQRDSSAPALSLSCGQSREELSCFAWLCPARLYAAAPLWMPGVDLLDSWSVGLVSFLGECPEDI